MCKGIASPLLTFHQDRDRFKLKEIILEAQRFLGEREGQLVVKLRGGGKGAGSLSERDFVSLLGRVVCWCCTFSDCFLRDVQKTNMIAKTDQSEYYYSVIKI